MAPRPMTPPAQGGTPAGTPAARLDPSQLLGGLVALGRGASNPAVAPVNVRPMGGLDLGAVASGAQAETGTRLQGGQDQLAGYLTSLLGEQGRNINAQTERDKRMAQFQQAMQLAAQGSDSSVAGMRDAAQASEGAANRAFQGDQAQLGRAFELGQAAIADPDAEARRQLDQYRSQRLIDQQLATQPAAATPLSDFGRHEIDPLRGQSLSALDPGVASQITSDPRWADDQSTIQDLVRKYGYSDPVKFQDELHKKFGNRDRTASLALWDYGYRPPTG